MLGDASHCVWFSGDAVLILECSDVRWWVLAPKLSDLRMLQKITAAGCLVTVTTFDSGCGC